jgi:hypothetical protein
MSLFDSLRNIESPELVRRRAYDPANYSGIKGSGLYNALNAGNAASDTQDQATASALASQMGGAAPSYDREMAMRAQLGALQPMDEKQKMQQFQMERQGQSDQDEWNRYMYDMARQQQQADQALIGQGLGTAMGVGAGYLGQRRAGRDQAQSQRRQTPYGPINNRYSQGF